MYLTRLRNATKDGFSQSFPPIRTQSNKFYIYHQYINIVFILQSTMFLEILIHEYISFLISIYLRSDIQEM